MRRSERQETRGRKLRGEREGREEKEGKIIT
jgi:hypothetical protein